MHGTSIVNRYFIYSHFLVLYTKDTKTINNLGALICEYERGLNMLWPYLQK